MEKRSVAIIHQSKLGLILPTGNIWRMPSINFENHESIYHALAHATEASIPYSAMHRVKNNHYGTFEESFRSASGEDVTKLSNVYLILVENPHSPHIEGKPIKFFSPETMRAMVMGELETKLIPLLQSDRYFEPIRTHPSNYQAIPSS